MSTISKPLSSSNSCNNSADNRLCPSAIIIIMTIRKIIIIKNNKSIDVISHISEILYEARERQRQAPQVIFNDKQIPKEVENYYNKKNLDDGRIFVTFVLEKRHFQERTKNNTVNLLHVLRNYLHYHIKSFKTCIHQHMQRKTNEFLKVLNRAKPPTNRSNPANFH
ncbi:hypothetical protein SNEBB_010644 [Seison nebaliae]|nr:hypothetical protein SNEBB_010644 [Seison nebaliae]